MFAPRLATMRIVALVFACLIALSGCIRSGEPAQDPGLRLRLEALAEATGGLFQSLERRPGEDRAARYAALVAQSDALRADAGRRPADPALEDALALHLSGYRRQLDRLAAEDSARPGAAPHPALIALRRAALSDALADALFYETTILDRSR